MDDLPRVGSRAVDEHIVALKRQGKRILELSAYPKRSLPAEILLAVEPYLRSLEHAPADGLPGLRAGFADYLHRETGCPVDPDTEMLVSSGAMHGLLCTFQGLLSPGDEVVVHTPNYFFDGLIQLAGGVPRHAPLAEHDGYAWDIDRFATQVTPRTKVLVISSPTNPTGHVASLEELQAVFALAERHGLWIVSDESYDRLVYDGRRHLSALHPALDRSRLILIRSFTKSFAMSPWRIACITCPSPVRAQILTILEWTILYGALFNQKLAELVITSDLRHLDGVANEFQRNRDRMIACLQDCPGLAYVAPQGNPFFFFNVGAWGMSDDQAAGLLLEEFGIPCTAGALHGEPGHVRVPFGGADEEIEAAIAGLQAVAARCYA
jgi:aminotransferase